MRPLRYGINVTLDGCCHHEAGLPPDAESMQFWTDEIARADVLLYGRVTYQMMESAWRRPSSGEWPDWMDEAEVRFAERIDRAPKVVASRTLHSVDWNAELLGTDLVDAVLELKRQAGGGISVGGVTLPTVLAQHGLIDEYVFLVHPVIAGRGPTLLAGMREQLRLELVDERPMTSGAVARRYRPT